MPTLLALIEQGGYPNFNFLYEQLGFSVTTVRSTRKAISAIKKSIPDIIVAEFNYQSNFRDRTSSLESLLASVERFPNTRAIVFYEKETKNQLDKLLKQFNVHKIMVYPIKEAVLKMTLIEALNDVLNDASKTLGSGKEGHQ